MSKRELYTTKEIAVKVDSTYMRVCYVIDKLKISPVRRGKIVRSGSGERWDKRCKIFGIAAVNQIRRELLAIDKRRRHGKSNQQAIRLAGAKTPAAADAAKGMHDEEGTEFLKAVDKFKTENRTRYLKLSDYLAVLKSLGYKKDF